MISDLSSLITDFEYFQRRSAENIRSIDSIFAFVSEYTQIEEIYSRSLLKLDSQYAKQDSGKYAAIINGLKDQVQQKAALSKGCFEKLKADKLQCLDVIQIHLNNMKKFAEDQRRLDRDLKLISSKTEKLMERYNKVCREYESTSIASFLTQRNIDMDPNQKGKLQSKVSQMNQDKAQMVHEKTDLEAQIQQQMEVQNNFIKNYQTELEKAIKQLETQEYDRTTSIKSCFIKHSAYFIDQQDRIKLTMIAAQENISNVEESSLQHQEQNIAYHPQEYTNPQVFKVYNSYLTNIVKKIQNKEEKVEDILNQECSAELRNQFMKVCGERLAKFDKVKVALANLQAQQLPSPQQQSPKSESKQLAGDQQPKAENSQSPSDQAAQGNPEPSLSQKKSDPAQTKEPGTNASLASPETMDLQPAVIQDLSEQVPADEKSKDKAEGGN